MRMFPPGACIYFAGLLFAESLRFGRRVRRLRIPRFDRKQQACRTSSEFVVLAGIILGIWVLPAVFACTDLLSSLDYALPVWALWIGTGLFLVGLVIRWKAQHDLGEAWSHTLETGAEQGLVTTGIYALSRHPLYVSLLFWAGAQPFLLHNVVAGWGGAVAVALVWLVRVPREERMMLEHFGEAYRRYMEKTGRVLTLSRSG